MTAVLGFYLPGDWREQALCAQVDPELWFPEKGHSASPALRICARCPVREPCAEAGKDEWHGVWGGTVPRQRHLRADGTWADVKPCGTLAAYKRHLRRGEEPCADCKRANAAATHDRQRARTAAPEWDGGPSYEWRREYLEEWAG